MNTHFKIIILEIFGLLMLACSPSKSITNTSTSHGGWIQAQALGGRSPVSQATGLSAIGASVTIGWNPMTSEAGTITSYAIYRSTISNGQDFTSPLSVNISAAIRTYTDTTVVPNTVYYYVVRPFVNTTQLSTLDTDSEIRIPVPPVNMALVHQWIANWEMCTQLMGRPIDRTQNYRCPYLGPINNEGFYDIGQNQFWDIVPIGCNYTPPNATANLSCGDSTNGCLGNSNGVPSISATTYAGQVYYDRTGIKCYVASGGSWIEANSANGTQILAMTSNQPGLPPLVNIGQSQAWLACQQLTLPGIGSKRLAKHSDHIVAAAWPPSFSDSQISTIENGLNLPTTGNCNSNSGDGLTYDTNPTPANLETLPGITGATGTVRTGSNATRNCVSMHGIQDMIGNVWNWNSDQLTLCSTSTHTCDAGSASSIDPSNTDWFWNAGALPINFDGTIAPGGTSEGQTGPNYTSSWLLASPTFGATEFLPPLGIPLVNAAHTQYDSMTIGPGSGQFNPSKFHSNDISVNTDAGSPARGARAGGGPTGSSSNGRFRLYVDQSPTSSGPSVGARCMIPVSI